MGIAALGALARSKDELIGVRSDVLEGHGNVNTVISLTRSKNERGESPGSPGVVQT